MGMVGVIYNLMISPTFQGEDRGEKGYLMMTSDWFKEFVFEIVVDKSVVPPEILAVGDMEPIVLPAWDPLGALAK